MPNCSNQPIGGPKDNHARQPQLTHFLAFPLVNAASLPQLAASVAKFQAATTAPKPLRPTEELARQREQEAETPERGNDGQKVEVSIGAAESNGGNADPMKVIPAAAQRPVGTLHLTLGVMSLETEEAVKRAVDVLRRADLRGMLQQVDQLYGGHKPEQVRDPGDAVAPVVDVMGAAEDVAAAITTLEKPVSPPPKVNRELQSAEEVRPLKVNMQGVGTFPERPQKPGSKTRVVFAQAHDAVPEEAGRLQAFAEMVRDHFVNEGIVNKEARPLRLHATVANSKYTKGYRGRSGARAMDAQEVVRVFGGEVSDDGSDGGGYGAGAGGFVWAKDVVIDRVRICKMGAVQSQDEVMGKEYPAIGVPGEEGQVAEVVFSR